MSVKPWYIKFEHEVSDKPQLRHVSRVFSKDSSAIKVLKVVDYKELAPLLESVSKHLKEPTDHSLEILKSRMTYWREIMLGLNERAL